MSLIARRTNDADESADGTQKRGKAAQTKPAKAPRERKPSKSPRGRASTTQANAPEAPAAAKASASKRPPVAGGRQEGLIVGAEPRVDLLPPEVRAERRNARTRRGLGWGVLAVLLVVLVATAGAFSLNVVSQAKLLTARSETASLLAQQQRYAPVREVQKEVALAQAAQQVGASTEVDWKAFLDQVGAAQPAGLALASVRK